MKKIIVFFALFYWPFSAFSDVNNDFLNAANQGNIDGVKSAIDAGADIHSRDIHGLDGLILGAKNGHTDVVEYFIDSGFCDTYEWAIIFATKGGHLKLIKKMINKCNVDSDKIYHSIFYYAASSGQIDVLKYAIKNVTDVYSKNKALKVAAEGGCLKIVKYLTKNGANSVGRDEALCLAAIHGYLDVVKYLLKFPININTKNIALVDAATGGHLNVVKYLVEHGANAKYTAAVSTNDLEILKYLVEEGADIFERDDNNNTILMSKTETDNLELVKYLVEYGIDINAQNYEGRTVLMNSLYYGSLPIIKYYVESGANLNITDKNGKTALDIAKSIPNDIKMYPDRFEIIEYLQGKQSD
ncbi:MAG: ankyrin repeat domain-containing protein [Alphaproteobacteria bacterium]|nr:ankyrin repeat domain-containing protein [Alphaproteobacteria bacterium]